jgi:hypothetical protein
MSARVPTPADPPATAKPATAIVVAIAVLASLAPWIAGGLLAPVAQPQSYHNFCDQRVFLRIPNALNVLSNLPFLLVGLLGLRALPGLTLLPPRSRSQAPWAVMFLGIALTAIGSSYYHIDPNDATLVWDRLPMTVAFAGLVAGTLADRSPRLTWPLLAVLLLVGAGSVVYWALRGNLVPYIVVQAGFIGAALAATAAVRSPYTLAARIYPATALYAGAMISERYDFEISALLANTVSGHTLKHLLAAASAYVLLRMLVERRLQQGRPSSAAG